MMYHKLNQFLSKGSKMVGELSVIAVSVGFLILGALFFLKAITYGLGNKSKFPSQAHLKFCMYMSLGIMTLYGSSMALVVGYGEEMELRLRLAMLVFLVLAILFYAAFRIIKKKLDKGEDD